MSSLQEHIDRSLRARECVCSSGILGFRTHRDGCPMADTEPRGRWYVNVYERGQRYGGPEEGGWWYDTGCFVPEKSGLLTDVTEKEAHQAARDLWSDLDEEAIDMIMLQQTYQASARYISTLSDLLDVLINL